MRIGIEAEINVDIVLILNPWHQCQAHRLLRSQGRTPGLCRRFYCDLDLARCASDTALLPREGAERAIPDYLERFCPDNVVFGPGLEKASAKGFRVLNNSPEKTAQVSDKLWLAGWLEKNGFPSIAHDYPWRGRFPAVVKPREGAGGVGCRIVERGGAQMQDGLIVQD